MKLKLLLLGILTVGAVSAQNFYDDGTIQEIRIYFTQSDWEAQLNIQQQTTQEYIQASSVVINGTEFSNVGVKYKGNSSYIPWHPKNPFHIELDHFQPHDYQGFTDIKLSNVIFDPTFVRETLSYEILRQYMAAPRCNYANVYVNDVLKGLYVNVESVSKKFVRKHFYSDENAFFDCSPVNGANNVSSLQELPSLMYWGDNVNMYNEAYRIKSETGFDDLIELTQILNSNPANIESVLDVDRVLWMLAFDNLLVNLDSYIGLFNQNYYLYKDDNGRFNPVIWDLNMSFGVFADLGSFVLPNTTAKQQLSPMQHVNDLTFPLVSRLLSMPKYKRRYLAHMHTIMQENFANGSYMTKAQALHDQIDAAVFADPNKLNTYNAFNVNLNNDVLTNNTLQAPGLSNLMQGRVNFLSALPDFTAAKPMISDIETSSPEPVIGTDVTITAQVLNTNADAVTLGFRHDLKAIFTKIQMFDDGNHNDGTAGDNVYGASVTVEGTYLQYYIYAENNTIGAFSPARAEYEFHILDAVYPMLTAGELAINEIMAQNTTTVTDPAGQYEDWIELYNNTPNTISLDNLHLSDNPDNLLKWKFPDGLTIEPNSYLIVWADEDLDEEGLHADVKLSASGESVILSYPNGTIVDSVTFGAQTANIAYARIPNGTGSFVTQAPTFNGNNESLSVDGFKLLEVSVYPNPASDMLTISANDEIAEVGIYNLLGQHIATQKANDRTVRIATDGLQGGVYLIRVKTAGHSGTVRIVKH